MNRHERQAALARQAAFDAAIKQIEGHPAYYSIQVELADKEDSILQKMPPDQAAYGTEERLALALALFEARCEMYLKIVTDREYHKAYSRCLEYFGRRAFKEYTGYPMELLQPFGATEQSITQAITTRVRYWGIEASRKIVAEDSKSVASVEPEGVGGKLKALREEARMTMEQVAEAIHVSVRTVERHESGDTDIRPGNLNSYEKLFSGRLGRTIRFS